MVSELVLFATPIATVAAAAVAAIPVYRQYRFQVAESGRLAEATRAEVDVRLLTLFVSLMGKAHARGDSGVSESAVQAALAPGSPFAPATPDELTEIVEHARYTLPVGFDEQEAAIAAVAELGVRYDVLRTPALVGLRGLAKWNDSSVALAPALSRLEAAEST